MAKDLVSIIMLSHNMGQFVEESVRSIIAQTYTNWELLLVDDASNDGTIQRLMELKDTLDKAIAKKIKISQTVSERGETCNRNSALKQARGRWMAFLDAGDIWTPEKLQKQIAFMEEHGYAMTYTMYGVMDMKSHHRGMIIGGKTHVTHQDMLKCCWPSYLTVMYDVKKVGLVQARCKQDNDYALWLNVTDKHDCYLLPENLATLRTKWGKLGRVLLTNQRKWRYEAFRIDEDLKPFKAYLYTIRNGAYGLVKWFKYAHRISVQ